ncbi:RNA deprotection pyrophosphohydrolase [Lederbergia citrea]|uniref:RNA deprotection pyrophosphohydrolase n=1 Tax=Lederbergia citrea TaxID=2833581 RepID=UPI001BCA582D|nr:nucleoside triphosphatase YtkD [Lederbergia citrea]MBS4202490.1 nucleoside triphosphatase YtkD [Lederbergia citrea]
MFEFNDVKGNQVFLSFKQASFSIEARHVLVICRFQKKWLLTNHSVRGLEFPGGKVEDQENINETAFREVYEETGGIVQSLTFIGEYFIEDVDLGPFVKAIFFAHIDKLDVKADYMETGGPVLISDDILAKLPNPEFSFIMQDEVVLRALAKVKELGLI